MRDDEKMLNIGVTMVVSVVCLIAFLQVCYRVQDNNLKSVRRSLENTQQEYDIAGTKFSALSSAGLLRASVAEINPKMEVVSFSKTVFIDDIPMVE
jgi:hypothetical protein